MAKTIETVAKEQSTKKNYTVSFFETGRKKAKKQDFATLPEARLFGIERYRTDQFNFLKNSKGVLLPL